MAPAPWPVAERMPTRRFGHFLLCMSMGPINGWWVWHTLNQDSEESTYCAGFFLTRRQDAAVASWVSGIKLFILAAVNIPGASRDGPRSPSLNSVLTPLPCACLSIPFKSSLVPAGHVKCLLRAACSDEELTEAFHRDTGLRQQRGKASSSMVTLQRTDNDAIYVHGNERHAWEMNAETCTEMDGNRGSGIVPARRHLVQ